MELDKRIIDGKKPLDCIDAESESVKSFIGKKGYFANHISEFIDISDLEEDVLTGINPDEPDCEVYKATCTTWEYFLPAEWVKEPEKKYRPLSFNEFLRLFDFGDGVCFRRKGQDTAEFSMYLGYEIDSDGNRDEIPGEGKVNLGGNRYTLAELFEYYEMRLDGEWQPFGVIDE